MDKVFPRFSAVFCAVIAILLVTDGLARAQARRPRAEITPLVELLGAHPGNTLWLALKVSLAEGFHTQSNTPRDSTLIPTTLSIDAPADVRIDELVFPHAADLKQAGLDALLSVFEHEFAIGVLATIASSTPTGEISIPAHLRSGHAMRTFAIRHRSRTCNGGSRSYQGTGASPSVTIRRFRASRSAAASVLRPSKHRGPLRERRLTRVPT